VKKTRRYRHHLGVWGLGLVCAACQAAPSKELMTARDVYAKARDSAAARVDPDALEDAYQALQAAEAVHEQSPGSRSERNYAYVSVRKSELAIANAREVVARQQQAQAEQAQGAKPYMEELAETRAALAAREQDLGQAVAAIIISQVQLQQLRAQRAGDGQLVVNRTGVFFDTGETELSPEARRQLDILANQLLAHPEQETVILGYADSSGDDAKNLELSKRRAEVVRDYLASRGLPAQGLRVMGLGAHHPVASNETPTGRASNRRVDIATAVEAPGERQNVKGTDADSEGDPETDEPGDAPEVEHQDPNDPDADRPETDEWQREDGDLAPELE
jgi:outer membrane protein OmpA-like peptidoglycan-associated protein